MGYPTPGGDRNQWGAKLLAARGVNVNADPLLEASCRVTKSAAQSIPNATWTAITWDVEDYDTDGMHDLVVNPDRVTIQRDGEYDVVCQGSFAVNASGQRRFAIEVNATKFGAMTRSLNVENAEGIIMLRRRFVAGDFVRVMVYQDSGGALDFLHDPGGGAAAASYLAVRFVGPST